MLVWIYLFVMVPREICDTTTTRDTRIHEPNPLPCVYTCKFIVTPFSDRQCYDNLVFIQRTTLWMFKFLAAHPATLRDTSDCHTQFVKRRRKRMQFEYLPMWKSCTVNMCTVTGIRVSRTSEVYLYIYCSSLYCIF